MSANIEIKARLANPQEAMEIARSLSAQGPDCIEQVDTFFNIGMHRLKLRVIANISAELIYYRRKNVLGPKRSSYTRVPVALPAVTRWLLAQFFGIRGEIRKKRLVYLLGHTRIHIDTVKDLGQFVEFESVLNEGNSSESGTMTIQRLINEFCIKERDLVEESYIDLLEADHDTPLIEQAQVN